MHMMRCVVLQEYGMRADIYQTMAQVEDTHWWFRARRSIIAHILSTLALPPNAAILDAGSGTGGNLQMLSQFGQVFAMEKDAEARALAEKRHILAVEEGSLPNEIPFGDRQFDLIVLFDVLEHIEQDYDTLRALHGRLKPEGKLMITVPAFEFLWSMHDVMHHHKRRYSLGPMTRLMERAGYTVTFASYINFWLFPVIAVVRIFDRITGGKLLTNKTSPNAELTIPAPTLNRTLESIFASEINCMKFMRFPFGVSIALVAQKA
jgi:SAM-dependent methyltransferase